MNELSCQSLFDKTIKEYNQNNNKTNKITETGKCSHKNLIIDNNVRQCSDCGMEVQRDILHDKEWRFYGAADTRHSSDPNRCQIRKSDERTIYKDVDNMGFSDKIISEADKLYGQVTGGKIFRGNSRKSIVFACIFHSYKIQGNAQSCESLIKAFSLDRKIALKGLKHVSLNAPKDSKIRNIYITPEHLITEIMDKFEANKNHKDEVLELYEKIKNKSTVINRSRPQSVASGLVRYYILLKRKDIPMNEFRSKVELSELTINRIVKEIEKILGKIN